MFMGPLEQTKPWQMAGVDGVYRFLHRVWRLIVNDQTGELGARVCDAPGESEPALWKLLHKTLKKVLADTEGMQFNTAISQMMIFVNEATSAKTLPKPLLKMFLACLAPYAPHIAEELWSRLGEKTLLATSAMPRHDEALCAEDSVTMVVTVNGKRRDELSVLRTIGVAEVEALALALPKVQRALEGKTPKKVIVVPGRVVNIVV
jgi:leucyl-tRNA synthetase